MCTWNLCESVSAGRCSERLQRAWNLARSGVVIGHACKPAQLLGPSSVPRSCRQAGRPPGMGMFGAAPARSTAAPVDGDTGPAAPAAGGRIMIVDTRAVGGQLMKIAIPLWNEDWCMKELTVFRQTALWASFVEVGRRGTWQHQPGRRWRFTRQTHASTEKRRGRAVRT